MKTCHLLKSFQLLINQEAWKRFVGFSTRTWLAAWDTLVQHLSFPHWVGHETAAVWIWLIKFHHLELLDPPVVCHTSALIIIYVTDSCITNFWSFLTDLLVPALILLVALFLSVFADINVDQACSQTNRADSLMSQWGCPLHHISVYHSPDWNEWFTISWSWLRLGAFIQTNWTKEIKN